MEDKNEIGKVFDEMQEGYTGKITRWVPFYEELISKGLSSLPYEFKATNILDLGSGNGNATENCLKRFPAGQYLLVDASTEMISEAKKRFRKKDNIKFKEAYFQELDLPENKYDLIVATLAMHHLQKGEKEVFIPKLYSSLTKKGILLIADLFINKDDADHAALLNQWENYAKSHNTTQEEWDFIMDHYDKYDFPNNYKTYEEMLKDSGFTDVSIAWDHTHWKVISAKK